MDPMLDPDLIEFLDDETLLAAFAMAGSTGDQGQSAIILAELTRRDLCPVPSAASRAAGRSCAVRESASLRL